MLLWRLLPWELFLGTWRGHRRGYCQIHLKADGPHMGLVFRVLVLWDPKVQGHGGKQTQPHHAHLLLHGTLKTQFPCQPSSHSIAALVLPVALWRASLQSEIEHLAQDAGCDEVENSGAQSLVNKDGQSQDLWHLEKQLLRQSAGVGQILWEGGLQHWTGHRVRGSLGKWRLHVFLQKMALLMLMLYKPELAMWTVGKVLLL